MAARKKASRKSGRRTKAFRYQDLPGRRHRELIVDRRFGSEGKNLAQLRLAAIREKQLSVARLAGMAGLSPAVPGQSNWVPLGPAAVPNGQTYGGARVLVSGRVTGIAIDPGNPNTIFVSGARGGVWKSIDGGANWTPQSDDAVSLAIGALAMAPSNSQRLYAGTGEGNIFYYAQNFPLNSINEDYHGVGLLRTDDGGGTWTQLGDATFTGAAFYRIRVHPTDPDTVLAATTFGLHRSTDGGTTWTQLTSGLPAISTSVLACTEVLFDPSDPTRAWCAFWGSGIYQTSNADASTPTWTKLAGGLPTASLQRISLAVAPSNTAVIYALIANSSDGFMGVYVSSDSGIIWTSVITSGITLFGAYTGHIAVDIATPDVVYVSGMNLYKLVKSGASWTSTDVGGSIHPDSHVFACHPTNHLVIYSGNDGGIYKSSDAGATWDDSINKGLSFLQLEFVGQHGTSDALVIGGTQDNGTEMFRNSPVFYHSADGDGGQGGIDPSNPNNVIHTYYSATPERSTLGGKFGSYAAIYGALSGASLFYPPWSFDDTNSNNLAIGLDRLRLSAAQGTDSWPTTVTLPGIGAGRVSAIHFVDSSTIYAGTSNGLVYEVTKSGGTWTATLISAAPLPARWIWDVFFMLSGGVKTLIVVMAGFGTAHVWRGSKPAAGWTWGDLSGTAPNRLPDAPANALQVDPVSTTTMYVATDVGVYRTTDTGVNWTLFNDGLPNVAVYDLKLHASTRTLRAATHGRGLWERKLDVSSEPPVRLVVRDNLMDTGRLTPPPSGVPCAWDDPLRQVSLNDTVYWWQCADVKVDAPLAGSYQMPVSSVDYLKFETTLEHRDPQRGKVNRVYVQVHNRGARDASNVVVKALYADASPGLPNLPSDFWLMFPADSAMPSPWTPIGAAQTIPALSRRQPAILEWDWTPPAALATHSCMLVISTCVDDPLTTTPLDIGSLITQNRQVGLKNLHVIDPLPSPIWSGIRFFPMASLDSFRWTRLPKGWSFGLIFPKKLSARELKLRGLEPRKLKAVEREIIRKQIGKAVELYDLTRVFESTLNASTHEITGLGATRNGLPFLIAFSSAKGATAGPVHLIHETRGGRILGGNTFVLRKGLQKRG
jgi:photosystem II stability/assembly factor-like uncharacterized protein